MQGLCMSIGQGEWDSLTSQDIAVTELCLVVVRISSLGT